MSYFPPATPPTVLTEDAMKQALIEARGDLFVAAQLLRISAMTMRRAIATSDCLQVVLQECGKVAAQADKSALTSAVESAIAERLSMYRVAGLDSLYELATMPIDANSAQNQVRLAAAARLAGETAGTAAGGEMGEILRTLNADYHTNAQRIRVVRERLTVEMQSGGGTTDTPIEHQPASPSAQTSP